MNILFCGDIFSNFESKTSSRSGIFFVASSLLKEFCSMDDIRVTVYCSPDKKAAVKRYLQSDFPGLVAETLRPLPHRSFLSWFETINKGRLEKGLAPIKGRGKMGRACKVLDRFFVKGDLKHFRDYDVFFSPCEAAPYVIEKAGIPIYTVIHDLIPIITGEFHVGNGYWLYDVLQQVSPEKNYFCISNCTRRDFLHYCPNADPEHVRVIYNGFDPRKEELEKEEMLQIIQSKGLLWKGYILILGNVVPHKNVERQMNAGVRFIKGSGMTDYRIAIVGGCNDTEEILQKAQIAADDRKYIVFCGYVPDAHIKAYYQGAFCLSFTSYYEGFGLPALEAMNEGCPVVTSNTSSLPEVVGDAAICISPEDSDAHVEAYMRLLNDKDFRNQIIERGRERVKQFSWENTAKQMIDEMKN